MKLVDQGLSNDAIARKLKTTWMQVRVVRDYARRGKKVVKPIIPIPEPFRSGARLKPKVEVEVVRLRDKGMSFVKIAKKLSIDNTTASRVYERCTGHRGRFRNLPAKVFETIRRLIAKGESIEAIAQAAGCSKNTVSRFKKDHPK